MSAWELLLKEPVLNFIAEWPILAFSGVVLWGMRDAFLKLRDDLRECIDHNEAVTDNLLKMVTATKK